MKYSEAIEISARIWGDKAMEQEVVDVELCNKIAKMLYETYRETEQ